MLSAMKIQTPRPPSLFGEFKHKGLEELLDKIFEPVWFDIDAFRKNIVARNQRINPHRTAHIQYRGIQITVLTDFFQQAIEVVKHRTPNELEVSLIPSVELFLHMREVTRRDYLSFKSHFIANNPKSDVDRNYLKNIKEQDALKLLKTYINDNPKLLTTYYFYYTKMVIRHDCEQP